MKSVYSIITSFVFACFALDISAQSFVHPGMDQSAKDLAYMKDKVLKGEQPYKAAFDRLKAAVDTNFIPVAHTHVMRGPYGRPNIGGNELSRSASMAYNYALAWYITNEKKYADKAIAILNTWSPVLWDFDYNDAKLLAAWTGHALCNAAEILRYTNAGWQQKDIESFTNMLMTVYYPLIRYYYPTANGNWDGAIIHSILAIAIFTDNRKMFDNAVDHYLHAPVNGSVFKYIYPSGQCQETMRDQGHVQLGLGEFAGAAQLAYTQGVDLFAAGDNRLALGYEYTAGFLFGQKPHSYGPISERAKELRDDYECVYRHYIAQGIQVPWTKKAADSVRNKASRSVLAALRAPAGQTVPKSVVLKASSPALIVGAGTLVKNSIPADAIYVSPGQSVQEALNTAAGTRKWVVIKNGIHTLPATLKIPSRVTLSGEGIGSVLFLDPASGLRDAIVNADDSMNEVSIRNLVIECSNKTDIASDPNGNRSYRGGYNRGGIVFRAQKEGQIGNIRLLNITVRNATFNGVAISGARFVTIDSCDLNENGGSVVPGPRLQHNLLLSHCRDVEVFHSRLSTSPNGSGIAIDHSNAIGIIGCEIARNGYYGIVVAESNNVIISNNLIEANDRSGVMVEFLQRGCDMVEVNNNRIQYNNGYGFEGYVIERLRQGTNTYTGNGNSKEQEKISAEKVIVME